MAPKKLAVIRYKGKLEQPQWVDLEPGQFGTSAVTGGLLNHDNFE
jgi:hypothetical protein